MRVNGHYWKLKDSYLFYNVAQKVSAFKQMNPDTRLYRLGIGDVTLPLAPAVVSAMKDAAEEMGHAETFRGYDDSQGYDFLREAVRGYYAKKNVALGLDEIFISDGAKSDLGNILDIFDAGIYALIPDPVYPVYVDTNIMAGNKVHYVNGTAENDFLPLPDHRVDTDVIYLCSPNNPTGAAYTRDQLKLWVDYALEKGAVILFDAAYEIFARGSGLPTSIFEIEGARECAIEFCSFSKTAGFTGTRCGYTVIPNDLKRGGASLNKLWLRRRTTKFNGVPYVVQRAAAAALSDEGYNQILANIQYYEQNAKTIAAALRDLNCWFTGGESAPYIWFKCPADLSSWGFFDHLLATANIVGTPGAGFGAQGEGFFRLTAFGQHETVEAAMERMKAAWL